MLPMGTIIPRGDKYRAVIRKAGHRPVTKSFSRQSMAKRWIAETELEMEKRERTSRHIDVSSLIQRRLNDGDSISPISHKQKILLRVIAKKTVGFTLDDLNVTGISRWHKKNCPDVSPASLNRYLTVIRTTLKFAESVWKIDVPWNEFAKARSHLRELGIIGESVDRTRRPTDDELRLLLKNTKSGFPMDDLVRFAIDTALRGIEICRITWDNVDFEKRLLTVHGRKHPRFKKGITSKIPLLGESLSIIMRQPRTPDPRIFPFKLGSVAAAFKSATVRADIEDLNFHDLRHEGISRLFEQGYTIPEVAMVSGHRSWNNLKKYTNLKPESLHRD